MTNARISSCVMVVFCVAGCTQMAPPGIEDAGALTGREPHERMDSGSSFASGDLRDGGRWDAATGSGDADAQTVDDISPVAMDAASDRDADGAPWPSSAGTADASVANAGLDARVNRSFDSADAADTDDAGKVDAQAAHDEPRLLIIVDQSTSMFASNLPNGGSPSVGGFPDRWELTRNSLSTVLPEFEHLRYGMVTFRDEGRTCPVVDELLSIEVHDGTASGEALLPSAEAIPPLKANTPLGNALELTHARLAAEPQRSRRYQLIITDGEPNTCAVPDPQCGQDRAIAAIQSAFDEGITTFVVGVGDQVGAYFLEQAAQAGQGHPVPPPLEHTVWCIGQELSSASFDIDNWRESALASYAQDGFEPSETRAHIVDGETQLLEHLRQILTQVAE